MLTCHLAIACHRRSPVLACHLSAPCDGRCIAWIPSVNMSFGYILNFDFVTDAASLGLTVIACHLATPCHRRCIAWLPSVSMPFWLHLVTDAASRGFPPLACHLATPCHRRCIAWFNSVSMSFGYSLLSTLHRAVSRRQRVIWLHLVTDAASRGFLVLTCHLATACHRRSIAASCFPSANMSFGYTLLPTLHRVVSMR